MEIWVQCRMLSSKNFHGILSFVNFIFSFFILPFQGLSPYNYAIFYDALLYECTGLYK